MPPPPRYTYHHYPATGNWYVYDRLLNRRVDVGASIVTVADMAYGYEARWRGLCERWQREERADGPPPSIF